MIFTDEPLCDIIDSLEKRLINEKRVVFEVLDPDCHRGSYAGTCIVLGEARYAYRSLHAWVELAQLLGCRMLIPERVEGRPHIKITFEKLLQKASFHDAVSISKEEKYGTVSPFAKIHKMEEPSFFYYYRQALENVHIAQRKKILDLGINRGDEFDVIKHLVTPGTFLGMKMVGIDHSKSAIQAAQKRFSYPNVHFYTHDINRLDTLNLERFDLLISIGTLQSPGIAFKPLLMALVQNYLYDNAALILAFPNSRWRDGELVYGAKVPNYTMSEMGHLCNDVIFAKKYLQQKKYRVTITGKDYLFVTATKIESRVN